MVDLLQNSELGDIRDKVIAGVRLGFDDGVRLYGSDDLLFLGSLANFVRERVHQKKV